MATREEALARSGSESDTESSSSGSGTDAGSDSSDATDPGAVADAASSLSSMLHFKNQAARLREQRQAALGMTAAAAVDAEETIERPVVPDRAAMDGLESSEDSGEESDSSVDSDATDPDFVLSPAFWKAVIKFKRKATKIRERKAEQAALEELAAGLFAEPEEMELSVELDQEPEPAPAPPEPEPEPKLEPELEPEPEPEPEPMPVPEPKLKPEPEPEPPQLGLPPSWGGWGSKPELEPAPQPEPALEPPPQLEPEPEQNRLELALTAREDVSPRAPRRRPPAAPTVSSAGAEGSTFVLGRGAEAGGGKGKIFAAHDAKLPRQNMRLFCEPSIHFHHHPEVNFLIASVETANEMWCLPLISWMVRLKVKNCGGIRGSSGRSRPCPPVEPVRLREKLGAPASR